MTASRPTPCSTRRSRISASVSGRRKPCQSRPQSATGGRQPALSSPSGRATRLPLSLAKASLLPGKARRQPEPAAGTGISPGCGRGRAHGGQHLRHADRLRIGDGEGAPRRAGRRQREDDRIGQVLDGEQRARRGRARRAAAAPAAARASAAPPYWPSRPARRPAPGAARPSRDRAAASPCSAASFERP